MPVIVKKRGGLVRMQDNTDVLPEINEFPQIRVNSGVKQFPNMPNTDFSQSNDDELPSFETTNNQPLKNDNLPTFNQSTLKDDLEVPLPPSSLRTKTHVKLQDIEDNYLQEQQIIENTRKEVRQHTKGPVFVNLKDFSHLMATIKASKNNFKTFSEQLQRLDNMSLTQNSELEKIQKISELIQRKIIIIDNRLFEKVEE